MATKVYANADVEKAQILCDTKGKSEYCDRKDVISREQHYLDTLEPPYNIAKVAGPATMTGRKQSPEGG
ncbi:hypothetical protein BC937DRAFT_88889 [Endogone sp. FLAS-F59071]|nr:hypothetical protein BC937DRAFT_88889 [Endogone sp. FLAS-F59071]|eukprot:RUS23422.1 hypothetical protein BC937DRAFT_88889 [Endogone sp. FLAS-F59071]